MAADWIKVRVDLHDDPAVAIICSTTGLDEYAVIGRLVRLWGWFDQQTADGNARVTLVYLDGRVGCVGFAQAMVDAGWLESQDDGHVAVPHFDRHNGQTGKRRALTARRVAAHRSGSGNASSNAGVTGAALAREEKSREEPTTDSPTPAARPVEPAPEPKPKKPRAAPTGPHAEFIAWWCAEFERVKGVPYAVQGAKDGRAVKTMLGYARDDLDVLKARSTALLETADSWLAERADLTMLCSSWNKLASAGKAPQRPSNAPISADKFQEYVNRCEDPNVIKRT